MEINLISKPLKWKDAKEERLLIGKILSAKSYTKAAVETILRKAWNLQVGFNVVEIASNAFMFSFESIEEYNIILRGRPCSINGFLLNLMEREKYKSCEEIDFSRCPVWVQMHNVLMEEICLENTIAIGGFVREVMMAEDPYYDDRYLRSFLRARIVVDLRKPLAYGFWLDRPEGGKVWISIRYEKLQSLCYKCGKIGHDNRGCNSDTLMSIFCPNEPRFGAWLTTKIFRNWDEAMVVVNSDWLEENYALQKKEEAVLRKKRATNRQPDLNASYDEEELFFIKVNKTVVKSPEVELGGDDGGKAPKEDTVNRVDRDSLAGDVAQSANLVTKVMTRGQDEHVKKEIGGLGGTLAVNAGIPSELGKEERQMAPTGMSAPSEEHKEDNLAMVLYRGRILSNVIDELNGLGLKRSADEDWNSSEPKRLRKTLEQVCPKLAISIYAENLRKTKAKIRRSVKRKGKSGKENIPEDSMDLEDFSGEPLDANFLETGFVFRAGEGRMVKDTTEGTSGWPTTATTAP
ncbi:hypothetical protein K1719_017508 [Acacia pycnantha]|nr:hypothetical protein K1719_017508 [Acacia pycnantha]